MRVTDISTPIHPDMIVWPTDPGVQLRPAKRLATGGSSNVSELTMGTHTGTHVDPPAHFIDGAPTAESLPLDALIGEAVVLGVSEEQQVTAAVLERSNVPATERLLLKTRNSSSIGHGRVPEDHAGVTEDAAGWMIEHGIRLVGIDFLSIEAPGQQGHPTHMRLLRDEIVIVEGLELAHVTPGVYTLICLPLRLVGGDGTPARAVLLDRAGAR